MDNDGSTSDWLFYEEISKQPISVIMGSNAGIIKTNGVNQLLPFRFSSVGLKS